MSNRLTVLIVAGVVAVFGVNKWVQHDIQKQAEAKAQEERAAREARAAALERQRQERIARIEREAPERKRRDEEYSVQLEAQLRSRDTLASMRGLAELADRYRDAARLAINTPRIALAQPVASIQQLAREARSIPVSPCTLPVRAALIEGIQATVDALMASMSKGDTETPSDRASDAINRFNAGMAECARNPAKA